MSKFRFSAIQEAQKRKPKEVEEFGKRSEFFGENVFNEKTMMQYLSKEAFEGVMYAIKNGKKIDKKNSQSSCVSNERLGYFQRGYTLYSLVSTFNRSYCRKA